MTTFTKSIAAFLASLALASTAFAGDLGYGSIKRAQADIGSLESRISNIEVSVDTNASFVARDEVTSRINGSKHFFQNRLN